MTSIVKVMNNPGLTGSQRSGVEAPATYVNRDIECS
jgi:hypothetical protein